MKHLSLTYWIAWALTCLGSTTLFVGCTDSDYDLNNVDLTMGLGSEGLSVKMGNTEKIFLENIIDVDETVKLDGSNRYYMVESGETEFNVRIEPVYINFEESVINTSHRVLSYSDVLQQSGLSEGAPELTVNAGFNAHGTAQGGTNANISVDRISPDIISVSSLNVGNTPVTLTMKTVAPSTVKFGIQKIRNLQIKLPKVIHVKSYPQGWTLNGDVLQYNGDLPYTDEKICQFFIDQMLPGEHGKVVNEQIILPTELVATSITGEVFFEASQSFKMNENDYADVQLALMLGNGNDVKVDEATGLFNPAINPNVDPINIAESLPDFLKDEEVRITAVNPTIKFATNMLEVPAGLDFSAELQARKSGPNAFTRKVTLPSVALNKQSFNTVYYYQKGAPYDPEGTDPTAITQQANNLNSLIEVLPDFVDVDLKNGKVKVQNREFTAQLDRDYHASTDYRVFIPFEFSKGLIIVYNDSTDSMNDDLADYAANGVQVTAQADNTIPLELLATVTAVDVNNQVLDGVVFSTARLAPSPDGETVQTTTLQIDAELTDPNLLKKIDRLFFKINAAADESERSHQLVSTQYLQIKDVRVKLKGQVIADFN